MTDEMPRKRRPLRKLFKIIVGLVILLALVIVLVPTAVSTKRGTGYALSFVNDRIPGTVSIDNMSIGWFHGPSLKGFSVIDPDGNAVMKIDSLDVADLSLWSLVSGSRAIGPIRVNEPVIRIEQYEDGLTNLDRTFMAPRTVQAPSVPTKKTAPRDQERSVVALGSAIELEIVNGRVTLVSPDARTVDVTDLSMSLQASDLNAMAFVIKAQVAERGMEGGAIDANGTLTNLFDRTSVAAGVEVSVRLVDFPTAAVDRLLGHDQKLELLLGPVIRGELEAHGTLDEIYASLHVQSEHLDTNVAFAVNDSQFKVASGSIVRLTIQPAAWELLTGRDKHAGGISLAEPFTVELEPVRLTGELARPEPQLDLSTIDAVLRLKVDDVVLDTGDRLGRVTITENTGELTFDGATLKAMLVSTAVHRSGETGDLALNAELSDLVGQDGKFSSLATSVKSIRGRISRWPVAVIDELLDAKGQLVALLGPTLDASIDSERQSDGKTVPVTLTADTPYLHCRVVAEFPGELPGELPGDHLKIRSGQIASFSVRPVLWQKLTEQFGQQLGALADFDLERPADLTIHAVKALFIPYKDILDLSAYADLELHARLALDDVDLVSIQDAGRVVLTKPSLEIDKGKDVRATFSAEVDHDGRSGQVLVHSAWRLDWKSANPMANMTAAIRPKLTDLPTSMLDEILGSGTQIVDLFGPTLGIAGKMDLDWIDRRLHAFGFDMDVSPMHLPVKDDVAIDLRDIHVAVPRTRINQTVNAKLTAKVLHEQNAGDLILDTQLTNLMKLEDLSVHAIAQLKPLATTTDASQLSPMTSETTIERLFNEHGKFDVAQMRLKTKTHIPQLPIGWVDAALGMEGNLLAAVGPVAAVELNGELPGDLDLTMQSDTTHISVPIHLTDDRSVLLRDDLIATLRITPQMAHSVLGKIQPIFADAVSSEEPVRLTLRKEPFRLPLKGDVGAFDPAQLDLEGTLNLGTLRMARKGWLRQSMTGIFGSSFQKSGSAPEGEPQIADESYLVTFTPLHFRVQNGQVETSELWATSTDLAVGFQGKADLKRQAYRFTMGILGASLLADAPERMREVIDPTNIYEVPVRGRIGQSPQVDYDPLVQDLIGSSAKVQLNKRVPGAGILIDLLGKPIQEERRRKSGLKWHPPEAVANMLKSFKAREPEKLESNVEKDSNIEKHEQAPEKMILDLFEQIRRASEQRKRKKKEKN